MTSTTTASGDDVVHISKESARRILSDVRELLTCPLHDNGIYYMHDEDDILTGYAMLYGQAGTLYDGGYFFFKIKFPADYPHTPLVVTFMTNDGKTRMHPNFYKNGYVCLSVLGNWRGEQWSGCITLKSVLLTMISIMDDKPLLHEPGVRENHIDFLPYHRSIEFKTIDFAMCKLLNDTEFNRYIQLPPSCVAYYRPIMRELFATNREKTLERVRALANITNNNNINNINNSNNNNSLTVSIYSMTTLIDYSLIIKSLTELQ
jgi:ubiquitin-conjugating enzyme E2 Z